MNKIHLYFRVPRQKDRYFPGDRYLIALAKRLLRKEKTSGIKKVFDNLHKGFDKLNISYDINLPFNKIRPCEPVVVLGNGNYALKGYKQPNPVIAGIALMTHPSEWPTLFYDYPLSKYLQHSNWANNVYIKYYGVEKCDIWAAGIDTTKWSPARKLNKNFDFLIYNKIRWNKEQLDDELRLPILKKLEQSGLSYKEITYGNYNEAEYFNLLNQCKAMIFLCEHESQGLACCEALSMDTPVLAWDQGFCLDPNRFSWNDPIIPATSIPFFDSRCGMSFKDFEEFNELINLFWQAVLDKSFKPREYILENLTLEKSAERMIEIINSVYK
jgi:glycosyltransferase involved in cell wall biosynthesis